ncbi:fumarylacetoacetate hydrolase family protein [Vibrio olivae]|uniref:Fumarylacetoacetate hydrolase family protein n=1 Tax=Vibrio olivae TaxID=1243002 RepID=A0ABV5HNE2_9VIBR
MYDIRVGEKRIKPTKVVCVGRNYLEHIQELNNAIPQQMVLFNKPVTAISNQLKAGLDEPNHYEAEICFVVKKGEFHAVGVGLDLTKRRLQSQLKEKGLPWERAKAFDGSAVLSRFVPLKGVNIDELQLELLINCVRVQYGEVKQMIYPPHTILDEIKSFSTLCDGDVVMTGTPKGVGEVHHGDVFLARLKVGDFTLVEVEWAVD